VGRAGPRAARLVVAHARDHGTLRRLHACPQPVNAASNAICRKVGFTLLGPRTYPGRNGGTVTVNDWRLDLRPPPPS
jgi:RimJ/RimL family protein N-acetyltransferase